MNCKICKVNKISSRGGKTCGLECACKLNGDDYKTVRAKLTNAIAESKLKCKKVTKKRMIWQ
jgi:hypothetical protein